MIEMKDCGASKAAQLMGWSLLLLLSIVATCEARCFFSNYTSDATSVDMSSCGLTSNNSADLTKFTNLNTLNLKSNELTTFPNVSASGSTLRTLDLRDNQITHISDDVIIHLTTLEKLYVMNNLLTTFPNVSASGSTLRYIALDENQITHISDDVISRLTKLEHLYLKGNLLTMFPNVSASGSTLKTLNMGANQITNISDDVLIHLTKLESLFLFHNLLTTFPNVTASGSTLKFIYLDVNQITHISDDVISHLTKLVVLYLRGNLLTTFPNVSASGNTLKTLHLDHNLLSDVNDTTFLTLVTLERLYLYNNPNLARFPHPVLGLKRIINLHIYDTSISHLPPILHENIADLRLDIQRSVDVCNCENVWLKQEGPKMTEFKYDDADCDGRQWSSTTTEDMIAQCKQQRKQKPKQFARAKAVPTKMPLSPFLLHSFARDTNKMKCMEKCMDTPGCMSFYWFRPQSGGGDCVLIAPGRSISVSWVPEGNLPVWTYFGLT